MGKLSKIVDKVENFVDGKLGRLLLRRDSDTLIFPNEIENVGQFMKFSIFREFQFQRDAFERGTIDTRIFLPLPANLNAGYSSEYANEELGVVGTAAAKNIGALIGNVSGAEDKVATATENIKNFAEGVRGDVGTAGVKSMGAQLASTEGGAVIGGLIGGILGGTVGAAAGGAIKGAFAGKGVARNPHLAVLFQGTGFRTHSFSYKLVPRNAEESRTITKIIRAFKHAMVPEYVEQNHFFRYPQQFRLELSNPDHLFKFQTCVLTGFNVNYHGEGGPFYHNIENGEEAPVSVTVEMNFTETRIITKDEIEEGL